MKEIAVISGKGGTGKTTVTAAFAGLCDAVLADCDVDASNLPLILTPEIEREEEFSGSVKAVKNELCTLCGECRRVCRFGAVTSDFDIIPVKCEGCGTCTLVCPVKAISLKETLTGKVFVSDTRYGPMVHAQLIIGEEASGKLVTRVRDMAEEIAETKNKEVILIDGSAGIGCPVIASIVGCRFVIMVTEPTLSGIYDLERIHDVISHFHIPCCVLINKYDINIRNVKRIESWCTQKGIPLGGKIPYDIRVVEALVSGKTVLEYKGSATERIKDIWGRIQDML